MGESLKKRILDSYLISIKTTIKVTKQNNSS